MSTINLTLIVDFLQFLTPFVKWGQNKKIPPPILDLKSAIFRFLYQLVITNHCISKWNINKLMERENTVVKVGFWRDLNPAQYYQRLMKNFRDDLDLTSFLLVHLRLIKFSCQGDFLRQRSFCWNNLCDGFWQEWHIWFSFIGVGLFKSTHGRIKTNFIPN